jgi:hypothetical protein
VRLAAALAPPRSEKAAVQIEALDPSAIVGNVNRDIRRCRHCAGIRIASAITQEIELTWSIACATPPRFNLTIGVQLDDPVVWLKASCT